MVHFDPNVKHGIYGNCSYAINVKTGDAIATWVSEACGKKDQKFSVKYLKRGCGGDYDTCRKSRCADARRQFITHFTAKCPESRASQRPSRGGGASSNPNATPQQVTETAKNVKNNGGNTVSSSDPERKQYCKEVCAKACGLNPFCHYAKWDCGCGGDVSGIFGEFPNLCEALPKPFNNCLLTGGVIVGGILLIMLLK